MIFRCLNSWLEILEKNQAASMYGIAHGNSFVVDSIPSGDIVNDAGNVIPFMNRKQRRELEKRLRKMNKKPKSVYLLGFFKIPLF